MTDETYNGWTNYETWLVGLWLDNDQSTYNYWREQARRHIAIAPASQYVKDGVWSVKEAPKYTLAQQLKAETERDSPFTEPDLFTDLFNAALSEVNWHEVAEHFLADLLETDEPDSEAVVFRYTRAQAIEDGVLVDVSKTAQEIGIAWHTALSASVWDRYIAVPQAAPWQDEPGRLWDILTMLRHAVRRSEGGQDVRFTVAVQNDEHPPRPVVLKAVSGPGDDGQPIITVMLPEED